jgi:putative colanic acid biosynthesis UDP-glucose lipid carrier transferase
MSWLIPIVGLFIKLESKGPVFFKQIRLGVDGKDFWCYKFRSMQVANNEGNLTVKNDPRVTRTGKFLRKTSLTKCHSL